MDADELHEVITLLKQEFEAGRIKINSSRTLEDMEKVAFGKDGKVDPATVSSSVRAMALAVKARKDSMELGQLSLRDVQVRYFKILEDSFGKPFEVMKRHGLNPQLIAEDMASTQSLVDAFYADWPEFAAGLQEFWEIHGPIVESHLQKQQSLKTMFGGDISPSYTTNIACSVGLYADTILLTDPLHRLVTIGSVIEQRVRFHLTVKHALIALSYKDLALAELDVPIVVVVPDYLAKRDYLNALQIVAEADSLEHCARMFGQHFSTMQDLKAFLEQFPDPEQLISKLVDPNRLLFDAEWSEPLDRQFERYAKEDQSRFSINSKGESSLVATMVFGRMMQINDALYQSVRYCGTPLIDAPTSWQYLLWKYEYGGDVPQLSGDEQRQLSITRAITIEGGEYGLLRGIPPESLIELRRNGATRELREIICKGISEINSAPDSMLSDIGKAITENINAAFSEHDRQLKDLASSRRKFYGVDVGRFVFFGGISIAAPVAHNLLVELLAGFTTIAGVPSPKDLMNSFRELRSRSENLRRSPAGIMFRHVKKNFGFS